MNPQSNIIWHIGTIGFSYEDWHGPFFPEGAKSQNYLSHYSRIFNAVEIDTTFHALPKGEIIQRWVEVTPENFCFALKMPKQFTHSLELVRSRTAINEFLGRVRLLGKKLGPILIQFPPSFHCDRMENLQEFISDLPTDLRFAVEVRHQSWYTRKIDSIPAIAELLSQFGICWAATDFPGLPAQVWRTADFAFIRWIGQNGSFINHSYERIDRIPELVSWKTLIQTNLHWIKEIYGFFNNDYAGFAPGTANRFKEIMGLPVIRNQELKQGRLF